MRSLKNTPFISFKNIQFSKLLKVEGRMREFNFRKSNPNGTVLFFIDVTDDRSKRILFQMQKNEAAWKIQPQLLPDWIVQNENRFHDLIEDELKDNL